MPKRDMTPQDSLAQRFEETRPHLRGVAYRMLGSLSEAEDAVQEAWLRLSAVDVATVANLPGWLTTVVSRICLDMLREREARREETLGVQPLELRVLHGDGVDPEGEAALADSVGIALLVVLDTLTPTERLAFVLHDVFAVPFDEIAVIMGRSLDATKQLASRARRRVRASPAPADPGRARQSEIVHAFLRAARTGDLAGLLAALHPDAVLHIEAALRTHAPAAEVGMAREVTGASKWAHQFILPARGAQFVQPALINGVVGVVFAPRGTLSRVLTFSFTDDRISRVEVIGDPARLRQLRIDVLD